MLHQTQLERLKTSFSPSRVVALIAALCVVVGTLAAAVPGGGVRQPQPKTVRRAVFATLPSFSPDGTKVAFIQFRVQQMSYGPSRQDFRVCIAHLEKRTLFCFPESLPTASGMVSVSPVRPAFATNAEKVLFVAHTAKFSCSAVYISQLDASGVSRLSGCNSSPNGMSVSPDGTSFAFSSSLSLTIQKFSGNSATTVWTPPTGSGENSGEMDGGNYAFSPDGTSAVPSYVEQIQLDRRIRFGNWFVVLRKGQ